MSAGAAIPEVTTIAYSLYSVVALDTGLSISVPVMQQCQQWHTVVPGNYDLVNGAILWQECAQ